MGYDTSRFMLTAIWLRTHEYQVKILTGLTLGQFLRVSLKLDRELERIANEEGKSRIRKRGGGRKGILRDREMRAALVLIHVRHYPVQEILAILFGVSQETICERLHPLLRCLQRVLGHEMVIPRRPNGRGEWLIPCVQGKSYIIDGFDRPIQRPKCPVRQKSHYSGKKKRHTVKNTVVIDASTKRIIGLGNTHQGSSHDKRIAEVDGLKFPEGSSHDQDTGYQGYSPIGSIPRQPKKKPKGKELSAWDKFSNRCISMERVRVEHAIRGIKISRAAKEVIRNRRAGYDDQIAEIAAGLYNLRLAA
jgi:hypothetical protein